MMRREMLTRRRCRALAWSRDQSAPLHHSSVPGCHRTILCVFLLVENHRWLTKFARKLQVRRVADVAGIKHAEVLDFLIMIPLYGEERKALPPGRTSEVRWPSNPHGPCTMHL